MRRAILVTLLMASAATFDVAQSDKLDFAMLGSIRDEGLNRSEVMDHVSWLSDVYGPRLTGSPGIQQASDVASCAPLRSRYQDHAQGSAEAKTCWTEKEALKCVHSSSRCCSPPYCQSSMV